MSDAPAGGSRIGLFGGTFDPVHFGHLRPAVELRERFGLDQVLMLPNHRPAHRDTPGATTRQRIEMLQLAIAEAPGLALDTREASRERPSWTVDTLTELRREHPQACLIFFLGVDSFADFERWHRWADILTLAHLVVIDRPGAELSAFAESLIARQIDAVGRYVDDAAAGVIERVNVTQLAISATDIRNHSRAGRNLRFLLPTCVREYIETHALYR